MLRVKRRTGVQRIRGLLAGLALAATLAAMLGATLTVNVTPFVAASLASYAVDLYLHRTEPQFMRRLGQLRAGVTIRALLRFTLLLLLLGESDLLINAEHRQMVALAPFLLIAQALFSSMCATIRRHRAMPVTTRNIGFGRLRIPNSPPRLLIGWPGQRLLHLELLVSIGLLAAILTDEGGWLVTALVSAVGISVATLLALIPFTVSAFGFPSPQRVMQNIDIWLLNYRPQVVLYFSGSRESAYQINMWLETLENLDTRVLVVLRERYLVKLLEPTRLPVICVPDAVHLMNMDLSSVQVALYPSNVGKNIHLLRVPTMKHVFIGHGDSDKIASVNPYSKVYDEVWVAGAAGRDRYATASVGVEDKDIVEVGRPQLDRVQSAAPRAARAAVPTVLYAPTWEGWTDEPGNTSLVASGEHIVRELLSSKRRVRVIYKPHPFIGIRSMEARLAHLRIVRMIEKSNGRRARSRLKENRGTRQRRRELALRADRIKRQMTAVKNRLNSQRGDDSQQSRDSAVTDPTLFLRLDELRQQWQAAHWGARPPWQNQVVQGPMPTLHECFDQADLLISDISSVSSDFVASLKPYALVNTTDLSEADFRRKNTVAGAAYLLEPGVHTVRRLLDILFAPEQDTLRTARERIRGYLLGPENPPSHERFNLAVNDLAARGGQEEMALLGADTNPPPSSPRRDDVDRPAPSGLPVTEPLSP